jgi:hypothetical protein
VKSIRRGGVFPNTSWGRFFEMEKKSELEKEISHSKKLAI